jgi:antitoxin component YwqK of YwqJK toxin-antitoxin module
MKRRVYLNILIAIGIYFAFVFLKDLDLENIFTENENFQKTEPKGLTKNELKQGEWKSFYKTGEIAEIANYKNDTLNGLHVIYEKNGKLKLYEKYNMGVKVDTFKMFVNGELNLIKKRDSIGKLQGEFRVYVDGKISQEGNYKNNKFHGEFKSYDLNTGKLSEIYEYENGVKSGKWIYLDSRGDTIKVIELDDEITTGNNGYN